MAQGFKYKSFIRTLTPGKPYHDAAEVLDTWGAADWELASVSVVRAGLQNQWVEIFYLKQRGAVTQLLPADSPPADSPP